MSRYKITKAYGENDSLIVIDENENELFRIPVDDFHTVQVLVSFENKNIRVFDVSSGKTIYEIESFVDVKITGVPVSITNIPPKEVI